MDSHFAWLLSTLPEERAWQLVRAIGTPQAVRAFNRFAAIARVNTLLDQGLTLNNAVHRAAYRASVAPTTVYRWMREMEKD